MTIEDLLQQAAAKGMTHFTLYPVHSVDRKTVYWHARVAPSTMHHYIEETDLDPVLAMQRALTALPKAPKRAKVTAAVNPNLRAQHNLPETILEPPTDEWEKFK